MVLHGQQLEKYVIFLMWLSSSAQCKEQVTRGIGDIDNPFVVQLPSGKILCAFRNHSKNTNGEYTCFRITICCSDNDGTSWSYLSTADQVSDGALIRNKS
jgi:hypothetical protein